MTTNKTPKALGPYSKSYKAGNLLFCSGQIGIDPEKDELVEWIENQTHQVCKNIEEVLKESYLKLEDVVKTTIFLSDINDFATVNDIYAAYFSHKPARSCVEVAQIPKWALVEIEVIAEFTT